MSDCQKCPIFDVPDGNRRTYSCRVESESEFLRHFDQTVTRPTVKTERTAIFEIFLYLRPFSLFIFLRFRG